jgi:2,7-dihydroxy-5-methyl-1-naphthoate 7-O-methyltransferase
MDLWTLSDLCTPWCIHVAATLRLADHLSHGELDLDSLAAACGADRDALGRMLRHLISKGLFAEPSPDRFALNDAARPLLDESARVGLALDGFGGRMANSWSTLLTAVRTGKPAYASLFGRPLWADLDAHPKLAASFDSLIGPPGHGIPDWRVLANPEDWSSIRTVVDLGGGTGALLAEILRANPNVRGTLVELPRAMAAARAIFEAAGVADRVTHAPQSFFDPLPAGADLYVIRNVLSDWPDSEAELLLRRAAQAASPQGRVVVFTPAAPGEPAPPELLMLVLMGGKGRSFEEFQALALRAGLHVTATGRQASGRSFVECRPLA